MSDVELSIESLEEKVSYGLGLQMGQQLARYNLDGVDLALVKLGLEEAFNGQHFRIPQSQLESAFNEINQGMEEKASELGEAVKKEGTAFLVENAKREGIVVTESGLQYEVIEEGGAEKPIASSKVRTHYEGSLISGKVFDSSVARGEPAEFPVNGVISGWTEALQMMGVGSKWRLYIPSELAYGEQGSPGAIPPHAALIFEVELLGIVG